MYQQWQAVAPLLDSLGHVVVDASPNSFALAQSMQAAKAQQPVAETALIWENLCPCSVTRVLNRQYAGRPLPLACGTRTDCLRNVLPNFRAAQS
jgi:hypothetical protein